MDPVTRTRWARLLNASLEKIAREPCEGFSATEERFIKMLNVLHDKDITMAVKYAYRYNEVQGRKDELEKYRQK